MRCQKCRFDQKCASFSPILDKNSQMIQNSRVSGTEEFRKWSEIRSLRGICPFQDEMIVAKGAVSKGFSSDKEVVRFVSRRNEMLNCFQLWVKGQSGSSDKLKNVFLVGVLSVLLKRLATFKVKGIDL